LHLAFGTLVIRLVDIIDSNRPLINFNMADQNIEDIQAVDKPKRRMSSRNQEGKSVTNNSTSKNNTSTSSTCHTLVTTNADCGLCKKIVPNDSAISCEVCAEWFHLECAKITMKEYTFLNKFNRYHWWCEKCDVLAMPLFDNLKIILQRQLELEDEVSQIKAKVSNQVDLGDEVRKMKSTISEHVDRSPQRSDNTIEKLTSHVDDSIKERMDRERRRNNVVIRNIPEGDTEDADLKALWEFLELENVVYEKPTRIGRKRGSGKSRPLKLELRNKSKKFDILKKAHTLGKSEDEKLKEIYISPDLTLAQRNERKTLRDELKRRKDNGEKDIAIRRGRILKIAIHTEENKTEEIPAEPQIQSDSTSQEVTPNGGLTPTAPPNEEN